MLKAIRIVLCQPHHPGNIGACARAMKNMGLSQLVLVSPQNFPDKQAFDRASGAEDVLLQARVVGSLSEAIGDCQWILGTSSRHREFPVPQLTPVQAAEKIGTFAQASQGVAVLFGSERAGLSNEELQSCDYHIVIPADPVYTSLNLACAVQVIAYEIYQYALLIEKGTEKPPEPVFEKASFDQVNGLVQHFEETAIKLGFMDPAHPEKLLPRLKRLFSKAQLEKEEVNMLRGFLKAIPSLDEKTALDLIPPLTGGRERSRPA